MKRFIEAIEGKPEVEAARLKAFEELADAQRGAPEIAMLRLQHALSGGVLSWCVEHVGDLTHRMCEHPDFIPASGYECVKPKVDKAVSMLSSTYWNQKHNEHGFYAEFMQNMRNNAEYFGQTLEEFMAKCKPYLEAYAAEHRKLRVYNTMQSLARDAAVALGELNFTDALFRLSTLQQFLESREKWHAAASKYDPSYGAQRITENPNKPLLTEAPIASIELQGEVFDEPQPFSSGTSFSKVDQRILTSKKGIAKIIRAFTKTPHNFEIFFVNLDFIDGEDDGVNDDVDRIARQNQTGVKKEWADIKGKAGTVRVVMMGNLSPSEAKMPMTGWTLAHKIGHAMQDECYNSGWVTPWAEPVKAILQMLNTIAAKQTGEPYIGSGAWFQMHGQLNDLLTMKSARAARDEREGGNAMIQGINDFEVFAEVVAQYLITGSAKLKVKPVLEPMVQALNDQIAHMFEELEGMVLVEV